MLLHMDFPSGSPGIYGTDDTKMMDGLWAQQGGFVVLMEDPDPNVTGNVLRVGTGGGANGTYIRLVLPALKTAVGVAFRLWMGNLPSGVYSPPSLQFLDNLNNRLMSVLVDSSGYLHVRNSNALVSGSDLAATSVPVLVAGAWNHIEVKYTVGAGTGAIEIRVNGITVLNVGSLAFSATSVAQIRFSSGDNASSQSRTYYYKDLIVWDTTGSFNNDFMGSCSVKELIPDGDVALNWALTGSVTGYGAVNEAPPDDDTKYIYAVTPAPAADLMSLTDLPVDVTSVRGLMIINRSKNTDGGDGKLQMGLVSGASTQLYTDRQITTTYTYWTDISETDPATAAAWLPGAVNAMNLRLNRTL